MIADAKDLVAEVIERTGIEGVATRAPLLVGMAENVLSQALETAQMETTVTLTTDSDGEVALPTDFLKVRNLYLENGKELYAQVLSNLKQDCNKGYAIQGATLLTSYPSTDLSLDYYASIPSVIDNDTNWLLAKDPSIYIYAVMAQAYLWKKMLDEAGAAASYADDRVSELNHTDRVARFGRNQMRVKGVNP